MNTTLEIIALIVVFLLIVLLNKLDNGDIQLSMWTWKRLEAVAGIVLFVLLTSPILFL